MTGEVERHQPSEIEQQVTWQQHARALEIRYAGIFDFSELTDDEKLVAVAALAPMAMAVVEEARDTIERLNEENADLRWRLDGLEK